MGVGRKDNRFVNISYLQKIGKEIIRQLQSGGSIRGLCILISITLHTNRVGRLRRDKQPRTKQTREDEETRAIHNDNQAISKIGAKIQHFFDISIIII